MTQTLPTAARTPDTSGHDRGDLLPSSRPGRVVALALATGFIAAVLLAVSVAVAATNARAGWLRRAFRSLPPLLVSIPVFWLGIVLLQVVSFRLGLVPVINANPVQALILPVLTIAVPIAAMVRIGGKA